MFMQFIVEIKNNLTISTNVFNLLLNNNQLFDKENIDVISNYII